MSTKSIDQLSKIGDLFNSWIRIAMILCGAAASCVYAYYRIFDNEKQIAIEIKERLDHEANAEARSDKRYKEAMEIANELKTYIKYQEEEIVKLREKQAYADGYIKGKEYTKERN